MKSLVLFLALAAAFTSVLRAAAPTPDSLPAPSAPPAAALVDNPLYPLWTTTAVGKTVTFNRVSQISGGAPVGGGPKPTTSKVKFLLTELTPEKALLKVGADPAKDGELLIVAAKLAPDDPALPKAAGQEDIKIGATTYACKVYYYTTRSATEAGRDTQGLPARITLWVAPSVPGGIVRRQVELTIKASYSTTDTWVGP